MSPATGSAPRPSKAARPARPAKPPAKRGGTGGGGGGVAPPAAAVLQLQSGAGNRAVADAIAEAGGGTNGASAVVQRLATPGTQTAPPPDTGRPGAQDDPRFRNLTGDVRAKQQQLRVHPPPAAAAAAAAGAAQAPADDLEAQGKAANAEKMNAAKPGEFDKAAFIRAVNDAITAQSPKNLDEADKFGDSGKANAVKDRVQGHVAAGKDTAAGPIETTTAAAPDTSRATVKQVTPLVPDRPPATPGAPDPSLAVPPAAPTSATDFSAGPAEVNQQLGEAEITEPQLANSNEPTFTDALADKKEAEAHAATAPGQVRGQEQQVLAGARAEAGQAGSAAMAALGQDRAQTGQAVTAGQHGTKGADEGRRAQVTARLQAVFDGTKRDVEGILTGLDKKVDTQFTAGEKAARDAFTAEHKRRMKAYKDERYSGLSGAGRWIKDKFAGLPEEANQIFVQARQGYVTRMQQVISSVADVIGAELNRAKQRIASGREQLQAEVRKLPADLQAIGREAAGEFSQRFDELTESVDAKGQELVDTLASKYNDALKAVDEEIAKEKEKNKGLVAKAVDSVKGVVKTVMELKTLLLGVLAKAAEAVMAILKDPIGFLGNLVSALGAGLKQFMANIGTHLQKGLLGWLLGTMAGAGITLPRKFDLRGIIELVAATLGLTWAMLRAKIGKKGVPEQALTAVEKSMPAAQKLRSQGVGGITDDIKGQTGDLKKGLFGQITRYLIPTVLIAGITWIISLLNPASAFVKACKMIIDIVTFIVTRGAQIVEFVTSVLDAVIAIAKGAAGGVPALVEKALARSIPVLIGVLAAILGVGGIAGKIQGFVKALAKPVMKGVDWVVDKIAAAGRKIWAKLKGAFGKKDKKGKPGDRGQEAGERKDGRDAAAPWKITRSLVMAGEHHTLTAQASGKRVTIEMASLNPDRLIRLAGKASDELKGSPHPKRKELQVLCAAVRMQSEKIEQALLTGPTPTQKRALDANLREIARSLVTMGKDYGIKSLQDIQVSLWIKDGKFFDYRNGVFMDGPMIRSRFYGGFNKAVKTSFLPGEKAMLFSAKAAKQAIWGSDPRFSLSTVYLCPGNGNTHPHLADSANGKERFELDHKRDVALHWKDTGHNTTQQDRTDFYNDVTNLALMCRICNNAKPKYLMILVPGPEFKGPGDR
jgi:hypothetical protein